MSRSKLIVFFPTWNNIEWLDSAFAHIEYWNPDQLYICEGAWDKKYPARSTDGTREYVEKYQHDKENVWIVDNIRDGKYRENQRSTCNLILRLSEAKPGDWIMYVAADCYFFKNAIDKYRELMEKENFDYPVWEVWNFWDSVTKYYPHRTKQQMNLPHRVKKGTHFTGTCHISLNGKKYHEHDNCTPFQVPQIGFHYEGIHNEERLEQKYNVGDRQSPVVWNNGIKLKQRNNWDGSHPSFAVPVLKEKFFYEEI
jgi:glycosyltransferase involved in cell wall biosynthesis